MPRATLLEYAAKTVRRIGRDVAAQIEPKGPEPDVRWDAPIGFSLQGAAALRDLLAADEDMYVRVAGQTWGDPRAHILYSALDEVEKTAMYLMRLREFLQGPELSPREDRLTRLMVTQLIEEQQARVRRMLEVLVVLILFSETNEQDYYRHLLLLEELDDLVSANADLDEFYGARSANISESVNRQIEWIRDVERKVALDRCWYLSNRTPIADAARLRPGHLLNSMRSRVRAAMPTMTNGEKLLFGFSYGNAYGHASEIVHYSTNRKDYRLQPGDEASSIGGLGLLSFAILDRCHALLGRPDIPIANRLRAILDSARAGELVHLATVRDIGVGDFVLAYSDLAEVLEVRESQYAYRSYHVRYLAEKPSPTIQQDWFPARYVQRLYSKEEFFRGLQRLVGEGKLPEDVVARLGALSEEELQDILRQSMVRTWQLGLRG